MFSWIHQFDLFLFDFDGLLVSTERLHYRSYIAAFQSFGFHLDWTFEEFTELAHRHAMIFRKALYEKFPTLNPNWDLLYTEKRKQYEKLIDEGAVDLMPGVEGLLKELERAQIRRCVATHSPRAPVEKIKQAHPCLQTIPLWITREDYLNPKPSSDCYHLAIQKLGEPGDRIIGFEDSIRGFQALQGTEALPVLICPSSNVPAGLDGLHFESLEQIQLS